MYLWTHWWSWFLCGWRQFDPLQCGQWQQHDMFENSLSCPRKALFPTRWSSAPGRGRAAVSPLPQNRQRAWGLRCSNGVSSCWRWRCRRVARHLHLRGEDKVGWMQENAQWNHMYTVSRKQQKASSCCGSTSVWKCYFSCPVIIFKVIFSYCEVCFNESERSVNNGADCWFTCRRC